MASGQLPFAVLFEGYSFESGAGEVGTGVGKGSGQLVGKIEGDLHGGSTSGASDGRETSCRSRRYKIFPNSVQGRFCDSATAG